MWRKLLLGTLVALAVLLTVGAVLFAYGTPQAPAVARAPAQSAAPEMPAALQPSSPLAIQVPGCVCHSDDPAVVAEHATYRLSECKGCHGGSTPTR